MKTITTAAALVSMLYVTSQASATPLSIALDVQGQGLSLTHGGTGYSGSPSNINVNIGGTVQAGLLYWMGYQSPAETVGFQPWRDQQVSFGGNTVTGTLIGTETSSTQINVGYLADVTS